MTIPTFEMNPDKIVTQKSAPIIVAGMHRSGTSLTTSILSKASLDIGDICVSEDSNNPNGYFEDVDFVEFQKRILMACCPGGGGGHQDWGWSVEEKLNFEGIQSFFPEAQALVGARENKEHRWGWKDPRTTLLLDFWDEVLAGKAYYLLVYRFPWDVADSMQRLGSDIFLRNPEYAYRIWTYYNEHICDFYSRNADRCILVSVNALRGDLPRFTSLLSEKFGLVETDVCLEDVFDSNLFSTLQGEDPLIPLVAEVWPECINLLNELDRLADISSAGLWHACPISDSSTCVAKREHEPPPKVSVVVPCYNQGTLLIEALASVQRFAAADCELIVVNDGSTDERTLEILNILKVRGYFVIDQKNMGLPAARNIGIAKARGAYILPLDDDNRIRSGFVQQAIQVLDSCPDVGVVYGDRYDFGLRRGIQKVPNFNLELMLKGNFIDACAIFRKQVWEDCDGYDPEMPILEDWEFWIHAAECGWGFHHLDAVTFDYRVRPDSLIGKTASLKVREAAYKRIWERHPAVYSTHLATLEIQLKAVEENANVQITYRDRLIADWEARLKAVNENANAQIAYRDQLIADWEARLKAVNENANAQITYRDQLITDREAELKAVSENANAQIAYRDQLISRMEKEFRIWRPIVSKLRGFKKTFLYCVNRLWH